jgi:hypothetical protein
MEAALTREQEYEGADLPAMEAATVPPDFAASLERAEVNAWLDLYAAAPADFAAKFALRLERRGDVVATLCPEIPFIHFNAVMNFGVSAEASEAELDALLALYREAGVKRPWFYHNPHCTPQALPGWYEARGLRRQSGWERIFRDGSRPLARSQLTAGFTIERVSVATAAAWAGFIDRLYGLPTSPWLTALVGRPGWSHYALRKAGEIAAVRSMFMDRDGMIWMGIDAPVPGVMAPSFDLDAMLCEAMVADGVTAGARGFVADIEAPQAVGDGPAYRNFAGLGFSKAYFRAHYGV